jgi:flagellar basal-body rod protein FlgG
MNRALWIAATGMESQQTRTDTIANNMANVSTHGYKRSVVHFQDMLYETRRMPGAATTASERPVGIQLGSGVRTVAVSKNFDQGTLEATSSSLDLAIEGRGFFEVELPDGRSGYTRTGSFHLNSSGEVVTADGYRVVGFPQIGTSATDIDIARDGSVSVTAAGDTREAGRIRLTRFTNAEGLQSLGNNLFAETNASGSVQRGNPGENGFGTLAQSFLETSNVEIVREMVDMIASQRAYELNSKSIKTADEMLSMASNLR